MVDIKYAYESEKNLIKKILKNKIRKIKINTKKRKWQECQR